MEAKELASRLRAAREARGLSQQRVAEELGLPRSAITQIEAGNRSVSTLELTKLANLYLRSVAQLLHEDEDLLLTLYRAEPGLADDRSTREHVQRCVNLCLEGVTLERLLGIRARLGPPSYETRLPTTSGEAVSQGEQIADQERRRLNIGNAPISDISELISSQGIWASGVKFPADNVSGLFLRHRTIGFAILVNGSHVRGRRRFSYAHEYAHALLDGDRIIRVSRADNSSDMVEKRANAFAAAFLMPRGGVHDALRNLGKGLPSRQEQTIFDVASDGRIEAELRSPSHSQRIMYKDIAMLAHHFGVSYQAALYRLKSLRYVSQRESEELLEQADLGRQYLKVLILFEEADAGENEQPRYRNRDICREVAHLAIEAYRREEISRGRILELSEILGISGEELLDFAEAARGE